MSTLSATVSLSDLTIPGTHQSCARRGGLFRFLQCQNPGFDISVQLSAGIRYLDVRCRVDRGALRLHHEFAYQHGQLGDVLACCAEFLDTHPGETVLLRIRQEYSEVAAGEFRDLFLACADRHGLSGRLWLERGVPSLGRARGRVVVLSGPYDVGGIVWKDPGVMDVQDHWSPRSRAQKLQRVLALLERTPGPDRRLVVNHTSGYRVPWLSPRAMAAYVNPRVTEAVRGLRQSTEGPLGLGVIAMDFADQASELVELLIDGNLPRPVGRAR